MSTESYDERFAYTFLIIIRRHAVAVADVGHAKDVRNTLGKTRNPYIYKFMRADLCGEGFLFSK